MKRALLGLLLGCLTMGIGSIAFAGDNQQAGIGLHVVSGLYEANDSTLCANAPVLTAAAVNPQGLGGPAYSVWVLVCNGSDSTGVGGAQFGIDINGPGGIGNTAFDWTLCADLDFPSPGWPGSGTDNLITYNTITNCQSTNSEAFVPKTVIAMLGALYIYDYGAGGAVAITPSPRSGGTAKVADCASAEDIIEPNASPGSNLGFAEFGGGAGYSPCGAPTPVESTTWGRIKSLNN